MGKQTGLGRSSFRVWLAIYWQDDTPWGFRPLRTIGTATSLEDITPFSSSRGILECGGQPFVYCAVEIRHSRLTLPARILLKVKNFFRCCTLEPTVGIIKRVSSLTSGRCMRVLAYHRTQNLSLQISVKISVFPSCISHFESPGEDRQATPNRQIFKTGKGTVRIKTFLAKESQPRQVESEWVEHAVDCPHFTQSERGILIADQRASFNFNWGKRGNLRNLVFPTCHTGQEERRVNSIWPTA
ncbi:hypothetical protein AVEN_223510-1 [Araneus ventricosus]|uniref:Uncharacterized protein n=1 Tax=Araneus ventricosus TaxID=182803 RepID=A0A4Y2DIG6_ARAVE|nr:hypothetical protein AVEN_223510-1 [Araneus ventricosus]